MNVFRFRGVLVGYATILLLSACEGRERRDAQAFLALYESLDHRAPAAAREQKVSALKQLTLVDPKVKQARDDCVSAHRALLNAESQHEQAAKQLDQAIAKDFEGAPLPASVGEPIRVAIEQADRSLADARNRFLRCEEGARSLSLRFGKR